jgi:hypothetical protein
MREKLERLLYLIDYVGTGAELGDDALAEARDLVIQLISMLDGLQAELKSKSTRRQ